MPASAATRATAASSAAGTGPDARAFDGDFPERSRKPDHDPGEQLEPTPITLTRVSGERAYKKVARSFASAGRNSTSRRAARPEPDNILQCRALA